jgi:AcrR family transcriptional regulator
MNARVSAFPTTRRGALARGPYRPGEETRARLVEAALTAFGRSGFDGASMRDIAARAGVAVPAIAYYFGDKQGLYRACAEHVLERYRQQVGASLTVLEPGAATPAPAAARDLLKRVVAALAAMLDEEADDWLAFMLAEMTSPGPAYATLSESLWQPGVCAVARLIALVRARAEAQEADRIDALLLLSSFSALVTGRAMTLACNGWTRLGSDEIAAVVARLHRIIDAL